MGFLGIDHYAVVLSYSAAILTVCNKVRKLLALAIYLELFVAPESVILPFMSNISMCIHS